MSSASWRSLARAVVLGAACVGMTSPARAQHVEIAGGAGWSTAPRETTWSSRYEPPFPFVTHEGEATQDLIVAPDAAPVAWASLAWFPGRHVGIEARADYRRFELRGTNGPYMVRMRYESRQPPDYIVREHLYERTDPWPDTSGHLGQFTATGALVLRAGDPDGATLRAIAGGGVTSIRGRLAPIGYTEFVLGGHSVLFPGERRLSARVEPSTTTGLVGGVEIALPAGRHAALVAGWRLFVPKRLDAPVRIDGFAESDEGFPEITLTEVQEALSPAPLSIRPVTSDLVAGIQIRF